MSTGITERLAVALSRRASRRGVLARTAVVGAAVAMDPVNYVLRPADAYTTVCGTGSSCTSGWTAFCVTVNKGVNQCPPGSYVAGWWKADHASVCGGKARYYIDCNASCIGGHPGRHTCRCRCSGTHGCDKRHTCCTQFRYGQCHQETRCYGPVVCRVVSCVPPWVWAPCSRASATDNRTLSHSAPELPRAFDGVERRYVALHGHGSPLGASVGGRRRVARGLVQGYEHGALALAPGRAPARLLLRTAGPWLARGGPSRLGWAVADEVPAFDEQGGLVRLTSAALWASPSASALCPAGPLSARWAQAVQRRSALGLPTGDAGAAAGGGQVAPFGDGLLLWSSATGAHAVTGDVARAYARRGREGGVLGYPVEDSGPVEGRPGSTRGAFAHGDLYVSSDRGDVAVLQPILDCYRQHPELGLPIADQQPDTAAAHRQVQAFERGTITLDTDTGQCTVTHA